MGVRCAVVTDVEVDGVNETGNSHGSQIEEGHEFVREYRKRLGVVKWSQVACRY